MFFLYFAFVNVDQYLHADDTNLDTWNSPGASRCQFLIEHVGSGIFTLQSRSNGIVPALYTIW